MKRVIIGMHIIFFPACFAMDGGAHGTSSSSAAVAAGTPSPQVAGSAASGSSQVAIPVKAVAVLSPSKEQQKVNGQALAYARCQDQFAKAFLATTFSDKEAQLLAQDDQFFAHARVMHTYLRHQLGRQEDQYNGLDQLTHAEVAKIGSLVSHYQKMEGAQMAHEQLVATNLHLAGSVHTLAQLELERKRRFEREHIVRESSREEELKNAASTGHLSAQITQLQGTLDLVCKEQLMAKNRAKELEKLVGEVANAGSHMLREFSVIKGFRVSRAGSPAAVAAASSANAASDGVDPKVVAAVQSLRHHMNLFTIQSGGESLTPPTTFSGTMQGMLHLIGLGSYSSSSSSSSSKTDK